MDDEDRAPTLKREREYGKEVSWSREKMWKASVAAATPERRRQGRHIIGWLGRCRQTQARHPRLGRRDPATDSRAEIEGYKVSLDVFMILYSTHNGCWDNVVSSQAVEHVVIGRSADGGVSAGVRLTSSQPRRRRLHRSPSC